ncbi:terpene cyclase/mutase family protein [Candidatus Bathyarchaeota archaeon]|nr:terpene cyclase/mutase family protein [Candidatus Bathyarchaeota archaeon]
MDGRPLAFIYHYGKTSLFNGYCPRKYNMQKLCHAASKLWSWLETWMDQEGGIHSYVVYHHRDNLKILSPDTWTQSTCILGLLGLHKATGETKELLQARRLSAYLANNYIRSIHVFRNSNFDRKPLGQPALEGNALPSYALLEICKLLSGGEEYELFTEIARDNIVNFLLKNWDEHAGAFTSIYHGDLAHIHNKNGLTIMAMLSLLDIDESNRMLMDKALRAGEFIVNRQVKNGVFKGAYPYADNDTNYRTTYTLITSLGLLKLYQKSYKALFLESVEKALQHLASFVDDKTGLICHVHKVGYPQWILDTFLLLMVTRKLLEFGYQVPINAEQILDKLLTRQYPTGAFPLSLGFEDLWFKKRLPSKPEINRWRDVLPVPALNSWILWAISELLPHGISLPPPSKSFPFILLTDAEETEGPFRITEYEDRVVFEKLPESRIVGIFRKRAELADLCLIRERGDYWKTIDLIMRYPEALRRLILGLPSRL